jgi:hypothetical protein
MGKRFSWRIELTLVVALSFFLAGCLLESDIQRSVQDLMRYDQLTDSFTLLQSWTDIKHKNKAGMKHLVSIWERRDRVITTPFTLLWEEPAIERLEDHKYQWIDLSDAKDQSAFNHPEINLDEIQIKLGGFYVNSP